jgi:hypothetical protein
LSFGALFLPLLGSAQESPENFKVEVTGSAWILDSGGTIQASGTPIDLVTDLGVHQEQPTFFGSLVFKPGRKHRIVIEGTPFRLDGFNTVSRQVTYRGQTFDVNQTLQSTADLNYFFAGYQYDVLSGRGGHMGFSLGGAYLDAIGTIHSVQINTTATKSETVGLPLAGMEFRAFPIPGHHWFDVDGGVRGMGLGSYGHYVETTGEGGLWLLGHIGLMAGYRAVNADIHDAGSSHSGVDVRLKGPIFSLIWKQ